MKRIFLFSLLALFGAVLGVEIITNGDNKVVSMPVRRRKLNENQKEYSFTKREGDGVYYADINIGTPKQTFSVIVDTGSSTIAVPCKDCDCGAHHHFDIDASASAINTHSQYRQCYSEGSCNQGALINDLICIGDTCAKDEAVSHSFGCCSKFAGAFKVQEADGIIGLSGGSGTLIEDLRSHHKLEKDEFSLCLGINGGAVNVGGFLSEKHLEPIQYLPLTQDSFYTVHLQKMFLNGAQIGSDVDVRPIIDSGTTFTYIPSSIHANLKQAFDSFCKGAGKCLGQKDPKGTPAMDIRDSLACYGKPEDMTYTDFTATFPSIELGFSTGAKICLPPFSYFYPSAKGIYCVGLLKDSGSKMVIGAISLAGFDVIFDHQNNQLGFARAICDSPEDLKTDSKDDEQMRQLREFFTLNSCCGSCKENAIYDFSPAVNPTEEIKSTSAPTPAKKEADNHADQEEREQNHEDQEDPEDEPGLLPTEPEESSWDEFTDSIKQQKIEEWIGVASGFVLALLCLSCCLIPGFASTICCRKDPHERSKYEPL